MAMATVTPCTSRPFSLYHPVETLRISSLPSQLKLNRLRGSSSAFNSQFRRGIRALSHKVSCIGHSNASVVTGDSWDKLILNSEIPVLVEFYASWCGPCRMVHRVIDEIAIDYKGRLDFFVLNADDDPKVADKYEIKAVPIVLLFKNGEKQHSIVGTMPREFYVSAIEKVLSS